MLLAVARVSGETAPLLFTALNNQFFSTNLNAPMASLPVVIFQFALSPYKDWQQPGLGRRPAHHRSPCSRSPSPPASSARSSQEPHDRTVPNGRRRVSHNRPPPGRAAPPPAKIPARQDAVRNLDFYYGNTQGAEDRSTCRSTTAQVTAFIGPSGCGKSTLLRVLNRMYDLYPGQRAEGEVLLDGENILDPRLDLNAAARPRRHGVPEADAVPDVDLREHRLRHPALRKAARKADMDDRVEKALRGAALWDEVKDKLNASGLSLSGGQQQRLCIARTVAIQPEVILFDEPCSALDPISTAKIEELIDELRDNYTIAIVTHNMQQAARVSRLHRLHVSRRAGRVRRHRPDLHDAARKQHPGLHHRPLRLIADANCTRTGSPWSNIPSNPTTTNSKLLGRKIAEMGGIAEKMLADAMDALAGFDTELAHKVIVADIRGSTRCSATSRSRRS